MKHLLPILLLVFSVGVGAETLNFLDGNTYVGGVLNGVPHGHGTFTWVNGEKYIGEWKDGKKHDQGTMTSPNGTKYVGEWYFDMEHGQGTLTFPSGSKYVGQWKKGKQHGQGTYTWTDGRKYVGEFKDGKKHGQGTFTSPDGNKYVGAWEESKQHGQGTITYLDGGKHVGEFKNGLPDGQGTLTYPDGSRYFGEWKRNAKHGQGTYTAANGDKYVGEWKTDETWEGEWYDSGGNVIGGVSGGSAVVVTELDDGSKYVGETKYGLLHGQGTWTHPDGGKYVGEYKDNRRHGQGTYTDSTGYKYVGEWRDAHQDGQGISIYADGGEYVGEHKRGYQHGHGTYTYANGDKLIGEFKRDYHWTGTRYDRSGWTIGKLLDGFPALHCPDRLRGKAKVGTGFLVNKNHVVTNAHVVDCCKKLTVLDFSCSDRQQASLVSMEHRSDLGLLRLDRPLKHYATLRSGNGLALGEAVSTYDTRPMRAGCPQYSFGQGKVTELNWMPDDSRLMNHDSPTSEGSSGGPVLDASGQIIGVTHAILTETFSESISQAIKQELLEAFLKTNNVDYNTAPSTEKLSLSEIKKKSDKFTVIIKCERDTEPTVSKASSKVTQAPTTTSSECKPKSQCFSLDASRGGYTKPEAGMSENTCKSTGGKWRCIEDCDCN
ncbi:trypsin-like peptidase domain-containing protein [Gammaproteobacteria bacterium]|nr:trypsin-like peptidase domain-containing protein [Gammaproteobacteria bacterium]